MVAEVVWDAISMEIIKKVGLDAFEAEDFIRSAKTVREKVAEGKVKGVGSVGKRAFAITYVVRVGAAIHIEVVDAELITSETLAKIRKDNGIEP
jgi:hypothetical protein